MRNLELLKTTLSAKGLSTEDLAKRCHVSTAYMEHVLAGHKVPRWTKLKLMANSLGLTPGELAPDETPQKTLQIITHGAPATDLSADTLKTVGDLAVHWVELTPFAGPISLTESPRLKEPQVTEHFISSLAQRKRKSLGLGSEDFITTEMLEGLLRSFGAYIVPLLKTPDPLVKGVVVLEKHSRNYWVALDLSCSYAQHRFELARAYGFCLAMHKLKGEKLLTFAEQFAQNLLITEEIVSRFKRNIPNYNVPPVQGTVELANRYGVPKETLYEMIFGEGRVNTDKAFANNLFSSGSSVMARVFGTDKPSMLQYLEDSQLRYKTPIFEALKNLQWEGDGPDSEIFEEALCLSKADAELMAKILFQGVCTRLAK